MIAILKQMFGLMTVIILLFWAFGVFMLRDPIKAGPVAAFVVIVGSFYFSQRFCARSYSQQIAGLASVLQAALLAGAIYGPDLPFAFHIQSFGCIALLGLVFWSIEVPQYPKLWNLTRNCVLGLLILGSVGTLMMLYHIRDSQLGSFMYSWFRGSHGFYAAMPLTLSGNGGALSQSYFLSVTQENGRYFFNGKGPYDGAVGGYYRNNPFLVSKGQYRDCIDGYGEPYFATTGSEPFSGIVEKYHRYYAVSYCSKEKNDTVVVLEGTAYKVIRMDGTLVRTLPYEAIDFAVDTQVSNDKTGVMQFRQNGRWGLMNREGDELLQAISSSPLRRETLKNDMYKVSSEQGVGLAAPGRGVILPMKFKNVSAVGIPTGERAQLSKDNTVALYYDGVYWVQTNENVWGLFAANQNEWLIEPTRLYTTIKGETIPHVSGYRPGVPEEALASFQMKGGVWRFMGTELHKLKGSEFTFDGTTGKFVSPRG